MRRRILIIGDRSDVRDIAPFLDGYGIPIVADAGAKTATSGDVAIIPVLQPRYDLDEILNVVYQRGARPVLFASDADLFRTEGDPSTINGWSSVRYCADHRCFDVILGSRSEALRRSQIERALVGSHPKVDQISIACPKRKVFVAISYEPPEWHARYYAHNLVHAIEKKRLTPILAQDTPGVATPAKLSGLIADSDFVLAVACDLTQSREEWPRFNPNVCLEVGIAVEQGKRVVLALPRACSYHRMPEDFKDFSTIHYEDELHLAIEIWFRIIKVAHGNL